MTLPAGRWKKVHKGLDAADALVRPKQPPVTLVPRPAFVMMALLLTVMALAAVMIAAVGHLSSDELLRFAHEMRRNCVRR